MVCLQAFCYCCIPHLMLSVVKIPVKGEVGGRALNIHGIFFIYFVLLLINSHGNYIVDHGKSWKNHRNVFLNFCGNPAVSMKGLSLFQGMIGNSNMPMSPESLSPGKQVSPYYQFKNNRPSIDESIRGKRCILHG